MGPSIQLSDEEVKTPLTTTGYRHDPRVYEQHKNTNFKVPRELVRAAATKDYRYWIAGDMQDQGNLPHCVEYSGRALLEANPARNQTEAIPRGSIYAWCQDNDEWAGNSYDGTSVHALMKWLKANGYISSYEWAKTVDEIHAHHMLRGPSVWGTAWHQGMSYIDEHGCARLTGQNWGGHAYLSRGGNRNRKDPVTGILGAFKLRNNWGFSYGLRGEAWINWKDAQNLIDDYGEIALPVELKRITPEVVQRALGSV